MPEPCICGHSRALHDIPRNCRRGCNCGACSVLGPGGPCGCTTYTPTPLATRRDAVAPKATTRT